MQPARTQRLLVASLLLASLASAGCASMNESECRAVDWRTIGYEDGAAGYSGDRIGQHRKACAKFGIAPNLALYQAGRDEGLREYCQPENGYRVGVNGGGYSGVCPADLSGAFTGAYQSGRQLYTLRSRVSDAQSSLYAKRRELNRIEGVMVGKSAAIVDDDSSAETRALALVDAKQLAEKAGRLKAEINQLEKDKVRYQRELEDYSASHPGVY